VFSLLVQTKDLARRQPMLFLQPEKQALIDSEIQVFCRFFSVAVTKICDPSPLRYNDTAQLPILLGVR
jgi:hypothetical protein